MYTIQWEYIFNLKLAIESFPYVIKGIWYTLLISFVSMFAGTMLGLFISLARMSKFALLRWPARLYISFMRGVPILVILFILYFGFPYIGIEFSAVTAALLGFSLNSAAYIAEINRSAISSVDKGQWEAAASLGLSYWKTMRGVILPQSVRVALPPLANVLLDLIKASSLAAMITVPELLQHAKIIGGREFDYMTMYILTALIYWAICSFAAAFQNILEKKYAHYL
ncbi:amino acid ABC transporter permease [Bacillus atrophaeus]|uniref:ABC transporter (Permease) n=1 Tax=Bacillus atrophaeus (strain 1942) TaxID=720555 RepID=A0ABN3ZFY2_BACA1|nr:ABC transporter permease subunit [Bacillus atrophaeus]AMR64169.1 cysteine ABC transporter permease [Bacillus subtilis subsp. globigii]ADP34984.1 putative ABC transporter (permease) [Bacillus atrophaeus 1942]AIK48877.1 amino ABC transporter, permease, 3-TM region, His/Glu/Gln/Arg/opine family domain protein [Bacillus atrophaeus subsp. globigii]EIM09773.1 putative ABC transporter permease [Bacillus atrophaeus C89]KFK81083.1 amino ABC transporter, permease, 3-TM region, His/Glu/Gln/Arg/opine f